MLLYPQYKIVKVFQHGQSLLVSQRVLNDHYVVLIKWLEVITGPHNKPYSSTKIFVSDLGSLLCSVIAVEDGMSVCQARRSRRVRGIHL